ncbi:MAG TPA: glycosyltransferase family 4 protein [Bacteroidia bacterium]|nr:glycosyltransferase family 4 protein [Bacteroidia bacterium]
MKLLVLYEELAGYFLACINAFAERHAADVIIVRKKVNAVAPFVFHESPRVKIVDRESFSEKELFDFAIGAAPGAIFCAGWGCKPYMTISRHFHGKIPVVLGFDNWWDGSLKQLILAQGARVSFRRRFSACFVPGKPQELFAEKLGFPRDKIATGAYCCDYDFFHGIFEKHEAAKKAHFPKRFIYAGRYAKEKNVEMLWEVFAELKKEIPGEWELWCLGKGDIVPPEIEGVRHLGFVQTSGMEEVMSRAGVFILPSTFEPWGVVVHEYAAAGFPMILSDKVGAAEFFLEPGKNGWKFNSGNRDELKSAMREAMRSPVLRLAEMGGESARLASLHTPALWADRLNALIAST